MNCGSLTGPYVYIDDVLFSGLTAKEDLETWIGDAAPQTATVHLVFIALHRYGTWRTRKRLTEVIKESGKDINLKWWRIAEFEDRQTYVNSSEVLRPASVPENELAEHYFNEIKLQGQYPPSMRESGKMGANKVFGSEEARNVLEQQFFLAGLRIRSLCDNPRTSMRPLGFQGFPSFGFGALTITFRNCPNNAPLALWWGRPYR